MKILYWSFHSVFVWAVVSLCWGADCQAVRAADDTPRNVDRAPKARIIDVHSAAASEAFHPNFPVIRSMVDRAMTNLTGKPTLTEAWLSLVSTQDVIGIKVFSAPGPNSGTRPAVVAALVEGLLAAGIPPQNVIVWDKQGAELRLAGFYELASKYGIRVASSAQAGYDPTNTYESSIIGTPLWGDYEFGKKGAGVGRKSFVSKLVSSEITRIINVTPMLNHNLAIVSGNLYSLASGSVDNFFRFESEASRLATAVPEIYAMSSLSDKVVLNVVDALLCQYEGGERGLLHYSATLNELRFSKDPVALDVLSAQELDHQRERAEAPAVNKPPMDLYSNAALLELGVNDPKKIDLTKIEL